ncbi:MAG: zinc ribbon domain-containing protein [Propionibacteriaceae bacterium]|nr:zinc ribbon domain-containing protein [Propionibacteriaceae bacterium]
MSEVTFCQSCGIPFDAEHASMIAQEADGSNSIYCIYCYKDGAFLQPDATAQDMIEMGVPHLAHKIGEQAAREQLSQFVPTLGRWQNS